MKKNSKQSEKLSLTNIISKQERERMKASEKKFKKMRYQSEKNTCWMYHKILMRMM